MFSDEDAIFLSNSVKYQTALFLMNLLVDRNLTQKIHHNLGTKMITVDNQFD